MRRTKGFVTAAAVCAVTGALVAAAGSAPLPPPANALLGGGSVGTRTAPGHADVKFTSIQISPDGTRLHFYGDWNARCDGGGVVTASFDEIVRISADGSFSGTGPVKSEVADGTFEFRGKLSRVALGGRSLDAARGTGRVRFAFRPDATRTHACDTAQVEWQARTTPKVTGKARPKNGGTYYGNTSDTLPFVMRVSPDGKQIVQAAALFVLDCNNRVEPILDAEIAPATPIGRSGSFVSVERSEETVRAAELWGEGSVMKYVAVFHGKFGTWAVRGGLTVKATVTARDGTTVDICASRPLSFAASL
jgi:hypothetical protein